LDAFDTDEEAHAGAASRSHIGSYRHGRGRWVGGFEADLFLDTSINNPLSSQLFEEERAEL
jgi:hypothetical protein